MLRPPLLVAVLLLLAASASAAEDHHDLRWDPKKPQASPTVYFDPGTGKFVPRPRNNRPASAGHRSSSGRARIERVEAASAAATRRRQHQLEDLVASLPLVRLKKAKKEEGGGFGGREILKKRARFIDHHVHGDHAFAASTR